MSSVCTGCFGVGEVGKTILELDGDCIEILKNAILKATELYILQKGEFYSLCILSQKIIFKK